MNDEDLIRSILERTSGSACASARGRIVAFADEELETLDVDLMRMHFSGCTACTALVAALRQMSADLPLLAEIEPDAQFIHDVLARTRPAPSLAARIRARIVAALALRPRIAWEIAYVGTCVLALARLVPETPVPGRALELVQPLTGEVSRAWEATASETESTITAVAESVRRGFGTLWDGAASQGEQSENRDGD